MLALVFQPYNHQPHNHQPQPPPTPNLQVVVNSWFDFLMLALIVASSVALALDSVKVGWQGGSGASYLRARELRLAVVFPSWPDVGCNSVLPVAGHEFWDFRPKPKTFFC
jgi:hypothetical protein